MNTITKIIISVGLLLLTNVMAYHIGKTSGNELTKEEINQEWNNMPDDLRELTKEFIIKFKLRVAK